MRVFTNRALPLVQKEKKKEEKNVIRELPPYRHKRRASRSRSIILPSLTTNSRIDRLPPLLVLGKL
jgi:hypothetical protein